MIKNDDIKNKKDVTGDENLIVKTGKKSETEKKSEPDSEIISGKRDEAKGSDGEKPPEDELKQLEQKLDEKVKQYEEIFEKLQRTAAEFENYKKRTQKEKEGIYNDAASDIIRTFLPVVDSIDRAVEACSNDSQGEETDECIKSGIELVKKQISDILKKLDVEEIHSVGKTFDPEYHNAVIHVEDESVGQNIIVEEFEKGYIMKEKIIRYSMVKVAN